MLTSDEAADAAAWFGGGKPSEAERGPPCVASSLRWIPPARPIRLPIYCIGDSSVWMYTGRDGISTSGELQERGDLEGFRVFHLGPATAHNLPNTTTASLGRQRMETFLTSGEIPAGATLLLSFGSVDCGGGLLGAKRRTGLALDVLAEASVARYVSVLAGLAAAGHVVIAAGPHGFTDIPVAVAGEPFRGTPEERNEAVRAFNDRLEVACREHGLGFFTFADAVRGPDGLLDPAACYDRTHLKTSFVATLCATVPALHGADRRRTEAAAGSDLDALRTEVARLSQLVQTVGFQVYVREMAELDVQPPARGAVARLRRWFTPRDAHQRGPGE